VQSESCAKSALRILRSSQDIAEHVIRWHPRWPHDSKAPSPLGPRTPHNSLVGASSPRTSCASARCRREIPNSHERFALRTTLPPSELPWLECVSAAAVAPSPDRKRPAPLALYDDSCCLRFD